MLEFTRVIDIPRYISHTYTSRLDLFAKDTRKSLLLATIGVARPSLVLPVIRKFRATISRLAPIWHSFPTAAMYFANPKPCGTVYVRVCMCVLRQRTLRYKFRSLALRGVDLHPNPNPRNPHCCNFYSATRGIPV